MPLDFWGNQSQHHFGLIACDTIAQLDAHPWPRVEDFDFAHLHVQAGRIQAADMTVAAGAYRPGLPDAQHAPRQTRKLCRMCSTRRGWTATWST